MQAPYGEAVAIRTSLEPWRCGGHEFDLAPVPSSKPRDEGHVTSLRQRLPPSPCGYGETSRHGRGHRNVRTEQQGHRKHERRRARYATGFWLYSCGESGR